MLHFTEFSCLNSHGVDVIERIFKNLKSVSLFYDSFVSCQHEILDVECFFEHDHSEVVYSASGFFKALLLDRLFGKL